MGGFDMDRGEFYWTAQNPITGQPANAPPHISDQEYLNFAPRIGLAYRILPRTVIRSAYGIFYNSNFGWEWSTGRGNWPFSISDNVTGINVPGVPPTRADQQFDLPGVVAVFSGGQQREGRERLGAGLAKTGCVMR